MNTQPAPRPVLTRDQQRTLAGLNHPGGIGHWTVHTRHQDGTIIVTCQPRIGARQYRAITPHGNTAVHTGPNPTDETIWPPHRGRNR